MSGLGSYLKGVSAEEAVSRAYTNSGFKIIEKRWKTKDGEIDLIAQHHEKIYFIEVKCSNTFDRAAERITLGQQQRIQNAALGYLAEKAKSLDVDCRFDAALVDENGQVLVLPGAFMCH